MCVINHHVTFQIVFLDTPKNANTSLRITNMIHAPINTLQIKLKLKIFKKIIRHYWKQIKNIDKTLDKLNEKENES